MRELALNKCRLDGRYDITEPLGRGSYAEIYIARDRMASPQSPHNTVVIKALNVFLQNDLDTDLERTLVENFQNEAIALDRVRHPNIISRLGHGTARDLRGTVFHYLVLEYLSGGDLARRCREKSLTLSQALNYLEQVCAGLGNAHKNNIIHRDIKPQNLLLTSDCETVKIADFGVARVNQSDSPITRVGTNVFAPPEHSPLLAGNDDAFTYKELTPAADIYSLAKSAYVLITCESPRFFSNQPVTELPFETRKEDFADDLLKILNKATQNNPADRHQNVIDFWSDLAKLKKYTDDNEFSTKLAPKFQLSPQPHVARGYTPIAPQKPSFNTSRDLKLKNFPIAEKPSPVISLDTRRNYIPLQNPSDNEQLKKNPEPQPIFVENENSVFENEVIKPKKNRKFLKRAATFVILLGLFAGVLFATHSYLKGIGILPNMGTLFGSKNGTANTDVNLRSGPNANSDRIGFVTKNSRIRIVNSQNNWYEIDVIEQGRIEENQNSVNHGWVNGRYIDAE
jgi:serine/threonine protein kinase